jgi:Flp pilus assembly pilin Flp
MKLMTVFSLRHWRQWTKSQSGISAVEFALIAPLMAVIYFGCIELSMMMTLDRKVTGATATLGDLTARASNVTNSDLSDIFEATRMVMQPEDMAKANMRITNLVEDEGTVKVVWSDACGTLVAYSEDDVISDLPDNLIPTDGTLIMAEINFPFNSPIGFFFQNSKSLSDTFYLRPRRVDSISRDDSTGSVTCGYTS